MTTVAVGSPRWSLPCARPRFATPRRTERQTLGPQVAATAQLLGRPLLAHQRYIADVSHELDPVTGRLVYDEVVVIIMRQQGKTELAPPVMAHRALEFPDRDGGLEQRILYAAQNASEAKKKWRRHQVKLLEASPLAPYLQVRYALNQEAILWDNGSSHSPMSTTGKTAGTGESTDLGWLDEAWVHDDSRAEQGLRPTMLTRPQPQLWIVSMVPGPTRAKTTQSRYLRAKQAKGRALVEAGVCEGTCYFEFSAPEGVDAGDPATWWDCMPALGQRTGAGRELVTEAAVARDFRVMELADFCAEYLGWWPDEAEGQRWLVITEQEWTAARRRRATFDPDGRVAVGVYVTPARDWAAIAVAGPRLGGGRLVEVTRDESGPDHRPGTSWLPRRMGQLVQRHGPLVVVTNDRATADAAQKQGLRVHRATSGDEQAAAGMLLDGVRPGGDVRHLGQPPLDAAVALADKHQLSQGFMFVPVEDGADLSPLGSVALALWGHATKRVHTAQRVPVAAAVDTGPARPGRRRRLDDQDAVDVNQARLLEQLERDGSR